MLKGLRCSSVTVINGLFLIDQFPWDNRFSNLDVNQKVHLFNQTIKNILCNFIPYETVTCDDRDPLWINSEIKGLIQEKNIAKKCYLQKKISVHTGSPNCHN